MIPQVPLSNTDFPMLEYPTPTTHMSTSVNDPLVNEDTREDEPLPHFSHIPPPNILRITYPFIDILLHADDVKSAFRRILYSSEMAVLFAHLFGQYLIIPVGQVFGSRSAPSFFNLASDIRADLATTGTLKENYPLHAFTPDGSRTTDIPQHHIH
jgi:hypothetical protein